MSENVLPLDELYFDSTIFQKYLESITNKFDFTENNYNASTIEKIPVEYTGARHQGELKDMHDKMERMRMELENGKKEAAEIKQAATEKLKEATKKLYTIKEAEKNASNANKLIIDICTKLKEMRDDLDMLTDEPGINPIREYTYKKVDKIIKSAMA